MKQRLKHFFLHTKIGKGIMKSLAILNTAEGIIHLLVAGIGLWGVIATGVWDIRILMPIIENFILGLFSILTGIAFGVVGHHHGHHHHEENEDEVIE